MHLPGFFSENCFQQSFYNSSDIFTANYVYPVFDVLSSWIFSRLAIFTEFWKIQALQIYVWIQKLLLADFSSIVSVMECMVNCRCITSSQEHKMLIWNISQMRIREVNHIIQTHITESGFKFKLIWLEMYMLPTREISLGSIKMYPPNQLPMFQISMYIF